MIATFCMLMRRRKLPELLRLQCRNLWKAAEMPCAHVVLVQNKFSENIYLSDCQLTHAQIALAS